MTCIVALVAAFVLGGLFYLLFAQGARCLEERRERREIDRLADERRAKEAEDEMTADDREKLKKALTETGGDTRRMAEIFVDLIKKSVRERAEMARAARVLADTINRNVSSTGQDFVILSDPPTWTDQ
jgi:hypothetical protein